MSDIKTTSQEFEVSGSLHEVRKTLVNEEPVDSQETLQFLSRKLDELIQEVNVLKNQNLFYQALDVLDILVTKGADPERIEAERDVIKDLIKEENN